jgi:hypothetical protein
LSVLLAALDHLGRGSETCGVVIDIDSFPAMMLGNGKYLMHDADVLVLVGRVVPPVPGFTMYFAESESVDVINGAPV